MADSSARSETANIEQPAELVAYLRRGGWIGGQEQPRVTNLAGGVSNRTVLVERAGGEAWVLKQALEQLRTKAEWHSSPLRIHREAMGMRWLERLAPGSIAPLVFEDHEHHLLAMRAVPPPHDNLKALLLAGQIEQDLIAQFGALLATVHRRAYEQREAVARAFADRSFFESLRIEPYYVHAASQVPAAAAFLDGLVARTRQRRLTLVHGDYSPKNVLVHASRLVLLDHEVIHFGDPAFDVGFALAHLLSKAHHLPSCRERLADASLLYWRVYREGLGNVPWLDDLEVMVVRHTLGCLLARVSGRSLLEYLDEAERGRQREVVVALMAAVPRGAADLVNAFLERIHEHADD
jgi:aminoglycoside phosphotransferase (APT) family kinase protein